MIIFNMSTSYFSQKKTLFHYFEDYLMEKTDLRVRKSHLKLCSPLYLYPILGLWKTLNGVCLMPLETGQP
jgi:hypothetical protein